VEARKRILEDYISPDDRDCFQDWIRGIRDTKARSAFRLRLNRVSDGNFGDCRPVGDGVHELRFHLGPGYRIYFGEDGDKVILLGGGEKPTQDADIKTVKRRWSDYNA
jgi:putative addiction module killer protein